MKVLIAYATYSSGTQTVSEGIEELLQELEYTVKRKIIADVNPDELGEYDFVIFGSPSWMIEHKDGQPHHLFLEFIKKSQNKTFPKTLFAIYGLGDTAYAHFCGAVDHLEEFIENLQGIHIKPSLRIDGYYFNQDEYDRNVKTWLHDILQKIPPHPTGSGGPSHL